MGREELPAALSPLEHAIWQTIAYVDVFDYPLTAAEIHRYLDGMAASAGAVQDALQNGRLCPQHLVQVEDYYMFAGREAIATTRERRDALSRQLWPAAIRYGRFISALPFVRMVAVTGSLAMNNVDEGADIDFLVVTANGRLWLCRALIIAIVRLAARNHLTLCPNYLLTESVLGFLDQNLYTAHEVTQMVPLTGMDTYHRLRRLNAWTRDFMPNAAGPPRDLATASGSYAALQRLAELPLRSRLGARLEQWEMKRKIRKLRAQTYDGHEVDFSPNWCKGHFDGHNRRTMTAYQARLESNP